MKVFGVGFHKTATSSLAAALSTLGFSVTGPDGHRPVSSREEARRLVDERIEQNTAFQDNPYPLFYEYIDKKAFDKKFVLTVRDEEAWIQSVVRDFGGRALRCAS